MLGSDPRHRLPTERPTQFDVDPEYLPDRYCMTVSGTCMEPEIADGALMEFEKGAVKPGDTVAIFRRPDSIGPGEFHILVKRLIAVTKEGVYMAMLNPPRTLWLPSEDVVGIHRCVGTMPLDQPRRLIRAARLLRLRRGDWSGVYHPQVTLPGYRGQETLVESVAVKLGGEQTRSTPSLPPL
jgi:hypothetical protein